MILGKVQKKWVIPISYLLKDYVLTQGVEKCKIVYNEAKKKYPNKYEFAGRIINDFGYELLYRGFNEEALGIFLFNVELEPEDATWYESVGYAYQEMDARDLAIEWYEKALAINPNQEYSKIKLNEFKETQ